MRLFGMSWPWPCGGTATRAFPEHGGGGGGGGFHQNWPTVVTTYGMLMRTHYGPFVVLRTSSNEGGKRKRSVPPPLIDLEDLLQTARQSTPMARMLPNAGKLLEYTEWASRRLSLSNECTTKQVAASMAIAKRHGLPEAIHIGASASTGHRWAFNEGWIGEFMQGSSIPRKEADADAEAQLAPLPSRRHTTPSTQGARKRASLPTAVRMAVWNRHFRKESGVGKCYCCAGVIFQQGFECGHVVAAAKGGSDAIDNLRPVCSICNKSQGDDHMDDFIAVYFPNSIRSATSATFDASLDASAAASASASASASAFDTLDATSPVRVRIRAKRTGCHGCPMNVD